jgi:hypothetical protein
MTKTNHKLLRFVDSSGIIRFLSSEDTEKNEGLIPLRTSLGELREDPTKPGEIEYLDIQTVKQGTLSDTGLFCLKN